MPVVEPELATDGVAESVIVSAVRSVPDDVVVVGDGVVVTSFPGNVTVGNGEVTSVPDEAATVGDVVVVTSFPGDVTAGDDVAVTLELHVR